MTFRPEATVMPIDLAGAFRLFWDREVGLGGIGGSFLSSQRAFSQDLWHRNHRLQPRGVPWWCVLFREKLRYHAAEAGGV